MNLSREEFEKLPALTAEDCTHETVYACLSANGGVHIVHGGAMAVRALVGTGDRDRRLVSRPARVGDLITRANAAVGMVVTNGLGEYRLLSVSDDGLGWTYADLAEPPRFAAWGTLDLPLTIVALPEPARDKTDAIVGCDANGVALLPEGWSESLPFPWDCLDDATIVALPEPAQESVAERQAREGSATAHRDYECDSCGRRIPKGARFHGDWHRCLACGVPPSPYAPAQEKAAPAAKVGDPLTPENARAGMRFLVKQCSQEWQIERVEEHCCWARQWPRAGSLVDLHFGAYTDCPITALPAPALPAPALLAPAPAMPTGRMAEVVASDGERFAPGDKVHLFSAPATVPWDGVPSREEKRRPGYCVRHGVLCCSRCDPFAEMTTEELRMLALCEECDVGTMDAAVIARLRAAGYVR